jgi:hypothetical protein
MRHARPRWISLELVMPPSAFLAMGRVPSRTMKQASVLSTNQGGGEEAACDLSRARAHRPACV